MKKLFVLFLLAVSVSACATADKTPTEKPVQKRTYPQINIPYSVEKSIKGLEGCTKEFAFEVMGLATGEKTIDGKKYFEWNLRNGGCIVDASIDDNGIVEKIYYQYTRQECVHMKLRITQYYRTHPAQSPETCPNRTDFQGDHRIKK